MVILTGANGFVGRQILRKLLSAGCQVRVIARDPAPFASLIADGQLEVTVTADLFAESPKRLEEFVSGAETLIHAAWYAEPGKYLTSPLNLVCLTGSLNLAVAFAHAGGKRFVGLGTVAEYSTTGGLMAADTPLDPTSLYAACKASTYFVLRNYLAQQAVSFAWCRLFYLYGEGEDPRRLVPYIRGQLETGNEALLSTGTQVRDFLDVNEAAALIFRVAFDQIEGAVNICSGQPATVRELAERIADEYGRRDLLRFGARPENLFDPPLVVGVRNRELFQSDGSRT